MAITFNEIPAGTYVPGVYVEIDPSGASKGATVRPHTALIIGYRLSTGTVAENIPKTVTRVTDAEGYFGKGSQVAEMVRAFKSTNTTTDLYVMGVDEAAGTAATGTFAIAGTATASGTFHAYVAGQRISVGVQGPIGATAGDSADTVGTNVAAAINADTTLPATASNTSGTVTLTARHKGPEGNDIDIQVNFRDTDKLPDGITNVTTPMASGATSPDATAAVAALAGQQYDTIVLGITDDATLDEYEDEMDNRWDAMVNQDGHIFVGFVGNYSDTITYTEQPARNSKHVTVIAPGPTPTPPWICASNLAAQDAKQDDPARPRTTLPLRDIVAPKVNDRFSWSDRNLLLQKGATTTLIDPGGNVLIESVTTSYQQDSFGNPDPTFRLLSTKRTVSWLRWSWLVRVQAKYARYKLADDGTKFGAGQLIVTPKVMKGEAIGWAENMINLGLVENLDQFKTDLVVERNSGDPNRLDVILPPDLINQLAVTATKQSFIL